ncbi:MAG TPA: peptidoglycan DD-metalloendopeptidase family protein [Flavisolibacter sp.]
MPDTLAITPVAELLRAHAADFGPVVSFHETDKIIPVDFSAESDMSAEVLSDENNFIHYMYEKLQREQARFGIGGYDEHRTLYNRSRLFGDENDGEPRRLHLGIDIWGRPHTAVMAPYDGIVHSLAFNNGFGDYGGTIILSHRLDGVTFHTLYGHLSLSSLKDSEPGDTIRKGDIFAEFGMPSENGQWPPHLHFQIIVDMEGMEGNYPGVCRYSEREKYLANCPDPDLILNMMRLLKK